MQHTPDTNTCISLSHRLDHPFTPSFTPDHPLTPRQLSQALANPLTTSLTPSLTPSPLHLSFHSLSYLLVHLFTPSLTPSPILAPPRSPLHLFVHPVTPSLPQANQPCYLSVRLQSSKHSNLTLLSLMWLEFRSFILLLILIGHSSTC